LLGIENDILETSTQITRRRMPPSASVDQKCIAVKVNVIVTMIRRQAPKKVTAVVKNRAGGNARGGKRERNKRRRRNFGKTQSVVNALNPKIPKTRNAPEVESLTSGIARVILVMI
jgi:hypothetical protein